MTNRKMHPADAADAKTIANAVRFGLSVFLGRGNYATETSETHDQAQAKAAELEAKHPALIYGIDASDRRALYVAPHNGIPAFLKRMPWRGVCDSDDIAMTRDASIRPPRQARHQSRNQHHQSRFPPNRRGARTPGCGNLSLRCERAAAENLWYFPFRPVEET